jgi:hypothetical protein
MVVSAGSASAQPAEHETRGVFGECLPVWAAANNVLTLYSRPDLRSERVEVPYREGWRIPAEKRDGLTRVLRVGALEVIKPDPLLHCPIPPKDGPAQLVAGETVDYLYYRGEGFGEIRFRGGQCQAQVAEDFGIFRLVRPPEVQAWLKVLFSDGTSPGWLLHDGSQARAARIIC